MDPKTRETLRKIEDRYLDPPECGCRPACESEREHRERGEFARDLFEDRAFNEWRDGQHGL